MKGALIALLVVALLAGVVFCWAVTWRDYDQLRTERSDIEARWRQLDKDMRERARKTSDIASAREQTLVIAAGAVLQAKTREAEMDASTQLSAELNAHPALRMDPKLLEPEKRLEDDQELYNDSIERYNTDLELFPRNFIASFTGLRRYDAYYRTK
jgi:LemA protein